MTKVKTAALLTIPVVLGKNAYFVTKKTEENLIDIEVVPILGAQFKDEDPSSPILEISSLNKKRYDYLAENRGGIKELGQIIIDEKEAIETATHYAEKDLKKAEKEFEKAKERVKLCKDVVKIFDDRETLEPPKGVGNTIIVDTSDSEEAEVDI
jgi:hypothetical protein